MYLDELKQSIAVVLSYFYGDKNSENNDERFAAITNDINALWFKLN